MCKNVTGLRLSRSTRATVLTYLGHLTPERQDRCLSKPLRGGRKNTLGVRNSIPRFIGLVGFKSSKQLSR